MTFSMSPTNAALKSTLILMRLRRWFRVSGFVFWVSGLGFRVSGLGFRV